jgi:hypothetical protein
MASTRSSIDSGFLSTPLAPEDSISFMSSSLTEEAVNINTLFDFSRSSFFNALKISNPLNSGIARSNSIASNLSSFIDCNPAFP